jgi:hypothetical protein
MDLEQLSLILKCSGYLLLLLGRITFCSDGLPVVHESEFVEILGFLSRSAVDFVCESNF